MRGSPGYRALAARGRMRKLSLAAAVFMVLPTLAFAQPRGRNADPMPSPQTVQAAARHAVAPMKTYKGQIMDSMCAAHGGHAYGYKLTHTHTPRACTLACIKAGARAVLFNEEQETIYQLDDQGEAEKFAGVNVTVQGTLDESTKTIHVSKISKQGVV